MSDEYFVVRRGRTTIPDSTVHDSNVSIPALGLLTVMLGLPAKAPMGYRAFLGRGLGEKAVRNVLRELEAAGYRWRFQTRAGGQLRTATLIFEEPASAAQAWDAAAKLVNGPLERCLNELTQESAAQADLEQNPLSRRAAAGAARYDKEKHDNAAGGTGSEMPSRTVQRFSAARSTVARSTVARSSAAQPSKDGSNGWVTAVTQPNQTEPAREDVPVSESVESRSPDGSAGSGLDGLLAQARDDVDGADWQVLVDCLPPRMRHVDPSAIGKVAEALRKRVEAGWSADALRATLAGNSLPPDSEIDNLAGLVCYRIGQIPLRPPKRQRQTQATTVPTVPAAAVVTPLAIRKRAEARETGSANADRPLSWWFEQYPAADVEASESA